MTRAFAYCAAEFAGYARRAAGVDPLLSPPVLAESFQPEWLEGHRFLFFMLHGLPDQPYWYNAQWETALTAEVIRQARLKGTVVFVANCYLPESPMLQALLDAGAAAVVGGSGENFVSAYLLAYHVRRLVARGMEIDTALEIAKGRLKRKAKRRKGLRDALAFEVWKA